MVANASPYRRQDSQGASSETGLILGTGFLFTRLPFSGLFPAGLAEPAGIPQSTPKKLFGVDVFCEGESGEKG